MRTVNNQQMSWDEIKVKYPHQYVGLTNVKYSINDVTIASAIVKYTSDDLNYEELITKCLNKEIVLRYTTLDEDELVGVVAI